MVDSVPEGVFLKGKMKVTNDIDESVFPNRVDLDSGKASTGEQARRHDYRWDKAEPLSDAAFSTIWTCHMSSFLNHPI